jgi:hypothetical protein
MIYDQELGLAACPEFAQGVVGNSAAEDLLQPLFRAGRLVAPIATASESQALAGRQLAAFPEEILRQEEPRPYPLLVDPRLEEFRRQWLQSISGE